MRGYILRKLLILLCSSLVFMASDANAACGVASHYGLGDGLHGKRVASGGRLNAYAMTAAHRSLPFGTKLNVTHGHRSVVVTITDRGPFVRGRILDLTTGAARALGMGGTGKVCYASL